MKFKVKILLGMLYVLFVLSISVMILVLMMMYLPQKIPMINFWRIMIDSAELIALALTRKPISVNAWSKDRLDVHPSHKPTSELMERIGATHGFFGSNDYPKEEDRDGLFYVSTDKHAKMICLGIFKTTILPVPATTVTVCLYKQINLEEIVWTK